MSWYCCVEHGDGNVKNIVITFSDIYEIGIIKLPFLTSYRLSSW